MMIVTGNISGKPLKDTSGLALENRCEAQCVRQHRPGSCNLVPACTEQLSRQQRHHM